MSPKEPEPLWREAIPDREPWRRGARSHHRHLGNRASGRSHFDHAGPHERAHRNVFRHAYHGLARRTAALFVWIGQNWARWIMAPIFIAYGCWGVVWGIIGGNGLMIITAIASLVIFSYLAIAPAVYAFARHQREQVTGWEVLAISAVFFLLLLTVGSAILAFANYQNTLKADATEFARMAFHRVFVNRDPEYLAAHSSSSRKRSSPRHFINRIQSELGQVQNVGPIGANFRTKFVPYRLELRGTAKARVIFDSSPVWSRSKSPALNQTGRSSTSVGITEARFRGVVHCEPLLPRL